MIGIGIDTGGTCTDAVLFDVSKNQVLSVAKTKTTKEELLIGIRRAVDLLDQESLKEVSFASISTTLATNACIENRGKKVKLILIGHLPKDPKSLLKKYGFEREEDIYFLEGIPEGGFCEPVAPDFEKLRKDAADFSDCAAFAVAQSYFEWNDAAFEKEAAEILQEQYHVPVVKASGLFSELNVYRRAVGAYLNAQLIPLIADFLEAVKAVFREKNLQVPIYIMRSDGSLMNEEFTRTHPVETILCGPAASTMGGLFGSDNKDVLIVDMGGTTTDVAFAENHMPVITDEGIKILGWQTFVKGLAIDTFGLGGDSCIRYHNGDVYLESFRVIPISSLGERETEILAGLRSLRGRNLSKSEFYHEGFRLNKQKIELDRYTELEKKLIGCLQKGPMLVHEIGEEMKCVVKALPYKRLEKEGVIMRFGLTPTDLMQITGDYPVYNETIARAACGCLAYFSGIAEKKIPELVYREVEEKLLRNLVRILLEHTVPKYQDGIDEKVRELIEESAKLETPSLFQVHYQADYELVGVGGPAKIFMPKVAEALGMKAVFPPFYQTANALGTMIGNVVVHDQIEVRMEQDGFGFTKDGISYFFEEAEEGEQEAEKILRLQTGKKALARGVLDEAQLVFETNIKRKELQLYGTPSVVSSMVEVRCSGRMGLIAH